MRISNDVAVISDRNGSLWDRTPDNGWRRRNSNFILRLEGVNNAFGPVTPADPDSGVTRPKACAGLSEAQVDHFAVAECGRRHVHGEHPVGGDAR